MATLFLRIDLWIWKKVISLKVDCKLRMMFPSELKTHGGPKKIQQYVESTGSRRKNRGKTYLLFFFQLYIFGGDIYTQFPLYVFVEIIEINCLLI